MNILAEAQRLVDGPRQALYGPPWDDYRRVAEITAAALDRDWSAPDALVQMLAVKLARIGHVVTLYDQGRATAAEAAALAEDSLVDLCGYAECLYRTLQHLGADDEST